MDLNDFFSPFLGASAYYSAYFGRGTGPILLDYVRCTGSESRLIDCPYDTYTGGDSHSEDAGVGCRTGKYSLPISMASPVTL